MKRGVYSSRRKKADTPVKPALEGKKGLNCRPKMCYEALCEEELADKCFQPASAQLKKAIQPKTGVQMCTIGHQTIRTATENTAGETNAVSCYEQPSMEQQSIKYNAALEELSESLDSSTFESDTEEDEPCYWEAVSSSSLPSPEIFRRNDSDDSWGSNTQFLPLDLTLKRKNSTLIDTTYAKNIYLCHPPNISAISDDSINFAEDTSSNWELEGEAEKQRHSKKTNGPQLNRRFKLSRKMSFCIKKKVTFKSPVAESDKLCESVQTYEQTQRSEETAKAQSTKYNCIKNKEMGVKMEKAEKNLNDPKQAKFFDFPSDAERDLFLQNSIDRCIKLRSLTFFPDAVTETTRLSI